MIRHMYVYVHDISETHNVAVDYCIAFYGKRFGAPVAKEKRKEK